MDVIRFGEKHKVKETTLVLGGFSSLHKGHLKLIEKAKEFKKPVSVMVIENKEFFRDSYVNYQTLDDTLQDLANSGVSLVILVKFNSKIASMNGNDFLKDIKELAKAKRTVTGKDFAMGKNKNLKAKDIEDNEIVEIQKVNNKKIGTTVLKEMVELGDVDVIKKITAFGFSQTLMFDSNLISKQNELVKLHPGIYAAWTIYNEIRYWSVVRVTMDKKYHLYIPQIQVVNRPIVARIFPIKKIRTIIKKDNEALTEDDKNKSHEYLKII